MIWWANSKVKCLKKKKQNFASEVQLVGPLCPQSLRIIFCQSQMAAFYAVFSPVWQMLKSKVLQMQSFYEGKWFALIKKSEWGPEGEQGETGNNRMGSGSKAIPRCLIYTAKNWSQADVSPSFETSQSGTNTGSNTWLNTTSFDCTNIQQQLK